MPNPTPDPLRHRAEQIYGASGTERCPHNDGGFCKSCMIQRITDALRAEGLAMARRQREADASIFSGTNALASGIADRIRAAPLVEPEAR